MNTYPVRSPLAVADFLLPLVHDKHLVEIGSRNGDLVTCLKNFTSTVTSMEANENYCRVIARRGVNVRCSPVRADNAVNVLPEADVYFFWLTPTASMNMVKILVSVACARQSSFRVVYALDGQIDANKVGGHVHALTSWGLQFVVRRIFFDETESYMQSMNGKPVADERNSASYLHPYVGRYGRWGVFHMVTIDVISSNSTVCAHTR